MTARAGVDWNGGLDDLMQHLRTLPEAMTREAGREIQDAAQQHYAVMNRVFPAKDKTGNLRRANTLVKTDTLTWRVRNRAPHSHLYEDGFNHVSVGRVDGHDVWVPAAQRIRARMVQQLRGVLTRVATRGGRLVETVR